MCVFTGKLKFNSIFFDDVKCYTPEGYTYDEHILDVEETLYQIERSGLRIELEKMKIGVDLKKNAVLCRSR